MLITKQRCAALIICAILCAETLNKKRGAGTYEHAGGWGDVDIINCSLHVGTVRKKAGTDLGESTRGSASTVREPGSSQPKFLTCQKFIRSSDDKLGAAYRPSLSPAHCTEKWHAKEAQIWSDSKMSRASWKSAQKRAQIWQCMPKFTEQIRVLSNFSSNFNLPCMGWNEICSVSQLSRPSGCFEYFIVLTPETGSKVTSS